jgi:hypothetical protein
MIHLLPWHGDVDHGHFVLSCQHQAAPPKSVTVSQNPFGRSAPRVRVLKKNRISLSSIILHVSLLVLVGDNGPVSRERHANRFSFVPHGASCSGLFANALALSRQIDRLGSKTELFRF